MGRRVCDGGPLAGTCTPYSKYFEFCVRLNNSVADSKGFVSNNVQQPRAINVNILQTYSLKQSLMIYGRLYA